ncbi:hypothetical protein [Agrobacterium genomosp. 13]|uniref:Uncharacterized protein n=1 Tax=Agrobacterium genomosp. 13 str. CFBP 6927 TaxID=1183428 RepID=A0ABM9VDR8_9HYPH|nr:hypothetical protein [Agrobacterium genomosp. 13]CUX22901.1 exported hypothetical protein [Agrobacterium genomosp. 13 str. CFBP 6927]
MPELSKIFDTPQLFAALMAALAAFTIWMLTQLVAMGAGFWKRAKEKEKFIRSLYAEIDFNTADMAIFLDAPISYVTFRERVKQNNDFVPHITDARHTHIYMKNIDSISATGREYVGDVVYFYGVLDKIRAKIDGIYLKSFTNISLEGREAAIRSLYEHAEEAKKTGETLLRTMERKYKRYQLKRKVRSLGVSKKQKAPKP